MTGGHGQCTVNMGTLNLGISEKQKQKAKAAAARFKLAKKQAEAEGKKKEEKKADIKKIQAAAKIAKKHLESGR